MKKLVSLLTAILIITQITVAQQLKFKTNTSFYYTWDAKEVDWVLMGKDTTSRTEITWNAELTSLKQVTKTGTANFTVKASKESSNKALFEYEVINQSTGAKFYLIVDLPNDYLKFIGKADDKSLFMVIYNIEKVWIDYQKEPSILGLLNGD